MRLQSISISAPPVLRFEIDDLADVVVLAGPNGVGKTRLLQRVVAFMRGGHVDPEARGTIVATCREEREAWNKAELDLTIPEDVNLLIATLQTSRRRQNWPSTLINIESDRTIQNLQPLQFSWDMPDPGEEAISWDTTFGYMRDRYQDTIHSMFRMIEAQKQAIANRAIQLRREGREQMNLSFDDPMGPFKEIFSMLLAPKELVDPSARVQRLEYSIEGQVLEFSTLSSGEREVVNIAFDLLLRKPRDCIIIFDEPELHLHPELSYKLIHTLRAIGPNNQFILSTHSPDIITGSLDQSVVFVSPPRLSATGHPENQAVPVSETDTTNQALRLLGQSIGIVALGKRIVLIEGEQSSLDKQTYGSILSSRYPGLVLVPSGGKHVIESFDTIYESVLNKTIWGVEFFMLCDRDSRPAPSPEEGAATNAGRLRILPRYHIENFFLDEIVWADAFSALESDSWLTDAAQIREALRQIALGFISYATALASSYEIRQHVGSVDLMPKNCHNLTLQETQDAVIACASAEQLRVDSALDQGTVRQIVQRNYEAIEKAVSDDNDEWKSLVPGKPLLGTFAGKANLQLGRAKTIYIRAAAESPQQPFQDIFDIFQTFATTT